MNEKIRDSFANPKHFGSLQTDYVGEAGNALCGDTITICAQVSDGMVEDMKFQAAGCIYSFTCAEAVSDIAIGKSVDEAEKISETDVIAFFNGLPEGKEHCAKMAVRAMRKALEPKEAKIEEPPLKLKTDREWKHIIAELFDEFIEDEARRRGSSVVLESIDVPKKRLTVKVEDSKQSVKSLVKDVVSRLGGFEIEFTGRN